MILHILKFAGISLGIYLIIAAGLILSQWPKQTTGKSLDFARIAGQSSALAPISRFTARDGANLAYRRIDGPEGPLFVVIHGSGAHGGMYQPLGAALAGMGSVVLPDLRGHGENSPRGDVAYIGQLEDDLADLIEATARPGQKVVLVGHSSGGGLAIRYGGNADLPAPDGVVLLAPFLHYRAPTMRENSGGWAQPLTRRIIGLSMLNTIGLRMLNGLRIITFRLPENGDALGMTGGYSFRLNTSYAPRGDYQADIAALPPFALIVGAEDEAFRADQFAPVLDSFENAGTVTVLDGVAHLDVIYAPQTHKVIADYVAGLGQR